MRRFIRFVLKILLMPIWVIVMIAGCGTVFFLWFIEDPYSENEVEQLKGFIKWCFRY